MIKIPNIIEAEYDANMVIKNVVDNPDGAFLTYSRLYHIATEDINTYIKEMKGSFQTTLTVGSSGDQGIAATYLGAKDVYFFDINRIDSYFLFLKKVALENLKRKDFLDFLVAQNTGIILDYHLFQKIEPFLPVPIQIFWNKLYEYFGYNNYYMSEELFRSPKKHAQMANIVNGYYANNKVYYETQAKVKKANWYFIESDFYHLDANLPLGIKYDQIILSNIYEYLNFGTETSIENAQKYISFIKDKILPYLNADGTLMAAYLCRYNDEVDEFIQKKLIEDPNGWARSTDFLHGLNLIEKYLRGWTGQNVSYHYLLAEIKKEFHNWELCETKMTGYGQSSATNDLAILIKK